MVTRPASSLAAGALALALALSAATARASEPSESDMKAAGEAYDRAKAAYDKSQYSEAAADFARADALVPNPVTLELAVRAAVQAGDGALAMTLVERSERDKVTPGLGAAVRQAKFKFAKKTGKYLIECPS